MLPVSFIFTFALSVTAFISAPFIACLIGSADGFDSADGIVPDVDETRPLRALSDSLNLPSLPEVEVRTPPVNLVPLSVSPKSSKDALDTISEVPAEAFLLSI